MLILSRKHDEKIIITVGTEVIEIMIVEIKTTEGKRVRLGFTASPYVTIDREEVYNDKCVHDLEQSKTTKHNKHPIVKFNNEK